MNTPTQNETQNIYETEQEIWSGKDICYGNRPVLEILEDAGYTGSQELHCVLAEAKYYKKHDRYYDKPSSYPPLSLREFIESITKTSDWIVKDYGIVYSPVTFKDSSTAKKNLEFLNAVRDYLFQRGVRNFFGATKIARVILEQEKHLKKIEAVERVLNRVKAIEKLIRSCKTKTEEMSSKSLANIPTYKIFSEVIRRKHCRTLARLTRVYSTVKKLAEDVENIQKKVFGEDTRFKMILILVTLHTFLKEHEELARKELGSFDQIIVLIEEGIELYASRAKVTKTKFMRELDKYNSYQSLHERHSAFRGSSVRDEYYAKLLSLSTTQEQLFFVVKLGEDTKCWPEAVRRLAQLKDLSPFERKR